ncbi:MAG: nucleotide exchange factor GrpE [Patescibacteria group bacterium]|nr:nucleotide exchange factor GrpE [Patescibacteria group bacterium]
MPAEYNPEWKQTYPEPTVGTLIYNDEGQVLLVRSPKWGERWHIPGGHVELGETCEDANKREVMEETGLEVDRVEYLGFQEAIAPKFFHRQAHFIFLDFAAHMCGGELKASDEMSEWVWVDPKEVLADKKYKIDPFTGTTLNNFIKHFEKNNGGTAEEYKTNWHRALADYQNLQKETATRRAEWAQMSEQQILEEFIPVYEHLKTAVTCHSREGGNPDAWMDGVKHVLKQFADILKNHGVEEIKTVGEKFNPELHEAVGHEPSDNAEEDEIIREISGGYTMGGRVIKAAKVIVAK